jgi:hypothetical protein
VYTALNSAKPEPYFQGRPCQPSPRNLGGVGPGRPLMGGRGPPCR